MAIRLGASLRSAIWTSEAVVTMASPTVQMPCIPVANRGKVAITADFCVVGPDGFDLSLYYAHSPTLPATRAHGPAATFTDAQ